MHKDSKDKAAMRRDSLFSADDMRLIGAVLVLALGLGVFARIRMTDTPDPQVVITVDSREVYKGAASGLGEGLKVEGIHGGYNIFVMEKDSSGRIGVRCTEADCPDKICVDTGLVTLPDQPVVCLPHRVTARIVEE